MKTFKTQHSSELNTDLLSLVVHHKRLHSTSIDQDFNERILYLDIETTGFNRSSDIVYLLGLLYIDATHSIVLEQFLCQKSSDEYELLYALNQRLLDIDTLIHFNGDSFDLPFLKARMQLYGLNENVSSCTSFDYYKVLRPFKKLFGTDNFKLKTLEKIALYHRTEELTGAELISIFRTYLSGDYAVESKFIDHNREDLYGLLYLNNLNSLFQLSKTPPNPSSSLYLMPHLTHILKNESLCIVWDNFNLNQMQEGFQFNCEVSQYQLKAFSSILELTLPTYQGSLNYYYDDYQNYYYLINEDYAIHKIIAEFVSQKHKKKATKETAYIKKEGHFVKCPLSKSIFLELCHTYDIQIPVFQESASSSTSFILYDDFTNHYSSLLVPIIQHLFL